jgi:hypothetical protein
MVRDENMMNERKKKGKKNFSSRVEQNLFMIVLCSTARRIFHI